MHRVLIASVPTSICLQDDRSPYRPRPETVQAAEDVTASRRKMRDFIVVRVGWEEVQWIEVLDSEDRESSVKPSAFHLLDHPAVASSSASTVSTIPTLYEIGF